MIQILVKPPNGNIITNDIEETKTIHQLKEILYLKTNIPTIFQILIYSGRILFDDKNINFYNIKEGSMLHMNLRMIPIRYPNRSIDSILGKRKSIN